MKIKIDRKDLLAGIQRVHGVVEKKNTMPILTHILMNTGEQSVSFFATDLEVGIQGSFKAEIIEPGSITVSARKLHEIIREFQEGPVSIQSDTNYWIVIESGKSRFRIVGLPPEEFPVVPPIESETSIEIEAPLFSSLIRRSLFASGENVPQYILNGLLIQIEKNSAAPGLIRLVATDGHRLAITEGEVTGESPFEQEGIILPKKAILEIKKALDEGSIEGLPSLSIGENQLVYRWGSVVITSRLIEGDFPNYKKAIPVGNDNYVAMQKSDLEGGLRRVSVLAREKTSAVKFSLESGYVILNASNPEMGEAREEISTSFEGEGFVTGFNARYLLDALNAVEGEEVILEFKQADSPCIIKEKSEGFLAVIMPMRV